MGKGQVMLVNEIMNSLGMDCKEAILYSNKLKSMILRELEKDSK